MIEFTLKVLQKEKNIPYSCAEFNLQMQQNSD